MTALVAASANDNAGMSDDDKLLLKEAQIAREAAERQQTELKAVLSRTLRELRQLRRRYAELYVESESQRCELQALRLRMAGMLSDREDFSQEYALAEILRTLNQRIECQWVLRDEITEFQSYLDSVLQVLQSSEALRYEVEERFSGLKQTVERFTEPLPSVVAGRGGGRELTDNACRVLAVNDELQTVVLDTGSGAGARVGSFWHTEESVPDPVKLRIVDVRDDLSAAVVVDGDFRQLKLGTRLLPGL